jgi:hypothetical protein
VVSETKRTNADRIAFLEWHINCSWIHKKNFMRKDLKGQPGGSNKSEGTGLSADMENEDLKKDEEMTEKYIAKPDKIADNVHERHHNRNTSKDDSTNAGGYKD